MPRTLSPLQLAGLKHQLRTALEGSFFSICGITQAAEILHVDRQQHPEAWETLRTAHCMAWSHFDQETRDELLSLVSLVLDIDPQIANSARISIPASVS